MTIVTHTSTTFGACSISLCHGLSMTDELPPCAPASNRSEAKDHMHVASTAKADPCSYSFRELLIFVSNYQAKSGWA